MIFAVYFLAEYGFVHLVCDIMQLVCDIVQWWGGRQK